MSRGPQKFKQSDLTKAIKATIKAGIAVCRVEIDKNGKIAIVTRSKNDAVFDEALETNEWDEVLR